MQQHLRCTQEQRPVQCTAVLPFLIAATKTHLSARAWLAFDSLAAHAHHLEMKLKAVLVFVTLTAAFSFPASAHAAGTKTSTQALSLDVDSIANFAGWRLNGDAHALNLGMGVGVRLDFELLQLPLRIGAYMVPVLTIGDGSVLSLSPMIAASVRKQLPLPIGFGLGWLAFSVGGEEPGLHDVHLRHLFLGGHFGLPLFDN